MAYTTNTKVKLLLGETSASDDALLTTLIAQAQDMIDVFVGRTFEADSDSTRTFDSERDVCGYRLWLDHDLAAITSITNGDGTVLTTSQYTTEPRNDTPYYAIRILSSTGQYWQANSTTGDPEDAISIAGRWAYSITAPDGIVRACEEWAVLLYKQRDSSSDLNRTVIAGNSTILPAGLSEATRKYLTDMRSLV